MERVTKKDADGHYYMVGDGIFSDWSVPEKFKGEEVDTIGAIEDILQGMDLDRLRELIQADQDGRCVIVTRCHECENHRDVDGNHYCKFWRMYCPDDSDFYCKAAKPR